MPPIGGLGGQWVTLWASAKAKTPAIYEVAKVPGHTQLKTSERYSHLSNETLLAAVDASANATGTDWGQAQTVKTGENSALVAA